MARGKKNEKEGDDLLDKLVGINRVSKATTGGRSMRFNSLVVVGAVSYTHLTLPTKA